MANPLMEGIGLLNAARGLLHELKTIPAALRGSSGNAANKVDSSQFAAALKEAYAAGASSAKTAAPSAPASVKAGPAIAQVQEKLAAFAAELGKLFKQEGVDTEVSDITLQLDATGKVIVANDHPQKAAIENLFQLFPGLTLGFRQLSMNAAAFQSAQQNVLYRQSYILNPASVPNGFSTINPANFQMVVGSEGIEWGFADTTSSDSSDSTTA